VEIGGFTAGVNYARPGGNVTGIDMEAGVESFVEDVELLHVALPTATRIGYLATQRSWDGPIAAVMREAAGKLGLTLSHVAIEPPISEPTIRAAFASIASAALEALYVNPSAAFGPYHALIGGLALEQGLPSMSSFREQAEAGGLISFGTDDPALFRRGADYVDRILDGGDPGEMAIEQSIEFEIVVNLRTAAALGLTMPQELMLRASEVIQ
jgi:putative ABC transport system substrate-binding protein